MLAVLTFTINSVQFYLYNAKSQGKVELTIVDQKTYMHFFTSPLNVSCMISVPLFPLTTMNEKYVMSLQMLHCSICSHAKKRLRPCKAQRNCKEPSTTGYRFHRVQC